MRKVTQKMMNPGIKKWFKKNPEEDSLENITCKNCETQFSGKFCPECGQSVKDYDRPFSFIFYNFVGDFFAFDTRFFRTFAALLIKPGFLTREYFAGKRIRYAPPFRIFIFTSFILFLLLQIYTNRGLTIVLDSDLKDAQIGLDSTSIAIADSVLNNMTVEMDSNDVTITDSILNQIGVALDTTKGVENLNFKVNMETFRDTRDLREVLNRYANVLEKKLENEDDPEERRKLREYIRLCRSPEQATAKMLEYMSWAFFLLLPLFALILRLVYVRRNHNFMRHLIFSIHIHSFIFVVIILIVGLYLTFNGNLETISAILMFLVPIYFIIALKKFYGQSTGKVILKFITVSVLYQLVFILMVGFAFLNALSII